VEWAKGFHPPIVQRRKAVTPVDPECRITMRYAIEHDLPAATPVPEMRKPFDVLAEGLVSKKSRGERI
jgi:hypothetical protein